MGNFIMTLNRGIFFRLLAYAPEELQREAKENARRAIPALCFTEDDIRRKFVEEGQWNAVPEAEQREAIQSLLDAGEYEYAVAAANQCIAESVERYIHDALLEEAERQAEIQFMS